MASNQTTEFPTRKESPSSTSWPSTESNFKCLRPGCMFSSNIPHTHPKNNENATDCWTEFPQDTKTDEFRSNTPIYNPSTSTGVWRDYPATQEREDQDLQDAVNQSLRDLDRTPASKTLDQQNVDQAMLSLSNEFRPIYDPEGDVLVYLGPPSKLASQSSGDYAHVKEHFSKSHRVKSSSILSLDSERLGKLLGPKSVRNERRLKKEGVIDAYNTDGIKFYVDLRPPNEDEEAVILVLDLTCTRGVLTYFKAQNYFGLPRTLVCGEDEFTTLADSIMGPKNSSPKPSERAPLQATKNAGGGGASGSSNLSTANAPNIPGQRVVDVAASELDYSSLRHRSGLERLLQAIVHRDPRLDSAPKVWTYFALARYFQCATNERINGWITRWIFTGANINFIQCNPEVAFRIGMGIESPTITRNAFSILVGEKALLQAYGEMDPTVLTPLTRSVHGRQLQLLDDDERNRIDHAAYALVQRVRQVFGDLVQGAMSWLQKSEEYSKLISFVCREPGEEAVVQEMIQLVKDYVRGRIYWVLCSDRQTEPQESPVRLKAAQSFLHGLPETFYEKYNILNQPMRIFTRTFWLALSRDSLANGTGNTTPDKKYSFSPDHGGWNSLSEAMRRDYENDPQNGIRVVAKTQLFSCTTTFNTMVAKYDLQDHPPPSIIAHTNTEENTSPRSTHQPKMSSISSVDRIPFDQLSVSNSKRSQLHGDSGNILPEKRRKVSFPGVAASPSVIAKTDLELPLRGSKDMADSDVFVDAEETVPSPWDQINIKGKARANDTAAEREYALQMELLDIERLRRALDFHPDHTKNHFKEFQPVWQCRAFGVDYTDFIDITRPEAELIRVYNSYGKYIQEPSLAPPHLAGATVQEPGTEVNLTKWETGNTYFHKELRPTTPPPTQSVTDETYCWYQSPGKTKDAFERSNDSNVPVKYYPPTTITVSKTHTENYNSWNANEVYSGPDGNHPTARRTPNTPKQSSPLAISTTAATDSNYLSINKMLEDFCQHLRRICNPILYPPHLFHGNDIVPVDLTDTLMCLDEDEWKYLPLWAGGCDDGTGGVFDEADVPNLEKGGFRGGKRGIGNVSGTPCASLDGSSMDSFSDVASDAVSSVGRASKDATDGTETVKSMSDGMSTAEGFMMQDELWEEVLRLSDSRRTENGFADAEMEEDTSTVRGAGSDIGADVGDEDVQGQMFGDLDDDNDDQAGEEHDEDEDDDMEIIGKDDL